MTRVRIVTFKLENLDDVSGEAPSVEARIPPMRPQLLRIDADVHVGKKAMVPTATRPLDWLAFRQTQREETIRPWLQGVVMPGLRTFRSRVVCRRISGTAGIFRCEAFG